MKKLIVKQTGICWIFRPAFKIAVLIAVLVFSFFLMPKTCVADENDGIYINEIMWAGSSASAADEWLELYNNSDISVSLKGWVIFDEVKNSPMLTIPSGDILPHGFFLISNNAKDYNKFSSKKESILNIDPDYINTDVSLSNSNFKISLQRPDLDDLSQPNKMITVDSAGDGKEPFDGEYDGQIASMQRVKYDLSGDRKEAWAVSMERKNLDTTATEYATPKAYGKTQITLEIQNNKVRLGEPIALKFDYQFFDPQNELKKVEVSLQSGNKIIAKQTNDFGAKEFTFNISEVCPKAVIGFYDDDDLFVSKFFDLVCYQISSQVKFYEVLPHPKNIDWNGNGVSDTSDEWIELVNFGAAEVSLDGWKIVDASGKTFQIINSKIVSEGFMIFFKNQTGISLNDAGETLFLYNPLDQLMDTIKIPSSSSKYDQSYAKWGDKWYWTATPTPAKVNEILDPSSQTAENYDELTDAQGKKVELQGEIRDLERTGFTIMVDAKPVFVEISDQNINLPIGTRLTVSGRARSGNPPYIVSSFSDIKTDSQNQSNGGKSSASTNDLANASVTEGLTIIKTIKTKKTKRLKFTANQVAQIVLGERSERFGSFNSSYILLCFSGILSFFMIVSIYDFCCRE